MTMTAMLCMTSTGFTLASSSLQSVDVVRSQSGASLERQARKLYKEGKFSEAAQVFTQAAEAYKTSSDPIHQALSLSNLSLCYQQLGRWKDANDIIAKSIAILNTKETTPQRLSALAQALNIQGELQLNTGQAEAALKSWERVADIYTQQKQPARVLTSQINQAQALQNLGLYRRSASLLATALKLPADYIDEPKKLQLSLKLISASPEKAIALRTLGDSLRVAGNLTSAQMTLQRSLDFAKQLRLPNIVALSQLSLGNTANAQADPTTALKFYKEASASSPNNNIRLQAELNELYLLVDTNQQDAARILLPQLKEQIEALPPSQTAIEARVNLANSIIQMAEKKQEEKSLEKTPENQEILLDAAKLLAVAIQQAKELGNSRLEADALGTLGKVYEDTHQWKESEDLTQKAVQLAQQVNAEDLAYRWQWQLGRVAKEQGKTEVAIAAYKEAINNIKSLRADLAGANPDLQFSFGKSVEPIHRELVELLITGNQKDQDHLKTARDVIEGLQLVELDNFFRQACLNAQPEQIDRVDKRAAVIYPIILKDQLAIITSLPKSGQNSQGKANKATETDKREFHYYTTKISKNDVDKLATRLRNNLNQANTSDLVKPLFQQMYDLIIAPQAADLKNSKVETLVFVLDGTLRSVPMAGLYDQQEKKYLIEKYSIALTPGLQLLAPRSRPEKQLGALVAGLSKSRPGYPALDKVAEEVKTIQRDIPSQVLLNEKFTNTAFQNKVSGISYPIVHLATHGQFGSTPDQTFIVTWDSKIKVNELSSLLKAVELSQGKALELLILSACETATGDAKSALGLAGIAVRSGARSTVATLWRVDDEASAQLMIQFYDELVKAKKTGTSKAEALRRAQLAILQKSQYKSPYYWAAYVLLGNWI
ncbi:MAG: CHAT domain-containing protein [Aetokthonos hydrillicola CCALA 1050]|nr:CHAT domain-containing protein [Aetokthonos hydrillicola CCALA 1050]MBW4584989.1 CHAT domain-containing protein [Aetokthonos hydrillicola CCALA 1050]